MAMTRTLRRRVESWQWRRCCGRNRRDWSIHEGGVGKEGVDVSFKMYWGIAEELVKDAELRK